MADFLEGIAEADERLGAPFPLPTRGLPLDRWVAVHGIGEHGAEVEWNLDDTRPDTPARLALYVGAEPPPPRALLADVPPETVHVGQTPGQVRRAALAEAQASLRPVLEIEWQQGGRHLRLTAQGPWALEELLAIAASVPPPDPV